MQRGIAADHVVTVAGPTYAPGWLVEEHGDVVAVGGGDPPTGCAFERLPRGTAVLPGFVDAHAHLALGGLAGVADDLPFLPWIERGLLPRILGPDPPDYAAGARASVARLLATGVTCVGDNFLNAAGASALRAAGLRGIHFHEVFGSMAPDEDAYWGAATRALDALPTTLGDFPFGYSPHTPWSCPKATFGRVAARARREGRRLSFHLSESAEEQALFLDRSGPLFERFEREGRVGRYDLGRSPTAALAAVGALGRDALAAHGVFLSDDDVRLLAETGTAVVHCPTSNAKLAEGVAPLGALLDAGVVVALGTDSAASSARLDLFDEMRAALWLGRATTRRVGAFTAATALRMATLDGARALGLEGRCGALLPGTFADYVALDVSEARHGGATDVVATIVWSCDARDVRRVVVGGATRFARES